jgi:hypothetical protein
VRRPRSKDPRGALAQDMRPAFEATTTPDTDGVAMRESEPCGAHAVTRGAHVMKGHTLTDEPRGAHVNRFDPLRSVERRALHAIRIESLDAPQGTPFTPDALVVDATRELGVSDVARATERTAARSSRRAAFPTRRRATHTSGKRGWGLAPVAGAAGALAVGLGGGAAFAYIAGSSASNVALTTSAVSVKAIGTTGSADLLPGRTGAAYFTLHNPNSFDATFDQVAPGATVVSDNTGACGNNYVSIAQTLPFTIPTAVTVSPGGTSGTESIPDLVKLAPNAPSTCQGVTFTVTLTLSGQS